jgi:hypothetical protein
MFCGSALSHLSMESYGTFSFFSVALHFGAVFSLLDKKDGHLIGSNVLFVCQILTVKIADVWDVTSCGVVEKY